MTHSLQCSLCVRTHSALTCSNCANDALWTKRCESATVLMDAERLEKEIEKVLEGNTGKVDAARAESEQTLLRIAEMKEQTRKVRDKNEETRAKIAALRQQRDLRQAHLARQTEGLEARRQATIDTLRTETAKLTGKLSQVANRTSEARVFLCRELVLLYHLRPVRKRWKASLGHIAAEPMQIGGLSIPTLAELNNTPAAHLSTVLGYISHLLILSALYLSIKLPHEIVLPKSGMPFGTVKTRSGQRPRPLSVSVDLPLLMRENPSTYSLFIEGYAMLCHNVGYLCFTQGLELSSIDELTTPATCLYRVLFQRESTPGHPLVFGHMSHASSLNYLAKAKGQDAMKMWTIGLNQILDVVRNTVQGDGVGAEWDLVDFDEQDADVVTDKQSEKSEKEDVREKGWTKVRVSSKNS